MTEDNVVEVPFDKELRLYIKGWVTYYNIATMKRLTEETDKW